MAPWTYAFIVLRSSMLLSHAKRNLPLTPAACFLPCVRRSCPVQDGRITASATFPKRHASWYLGDLWKLARNGHMKQWEYRFLPAATSPMRRPPHIRTIHNLCGHHHRCGHHHHKRGHPPPQTRPPTTTGAATHHHRRGHPPPQVRPPTTTSAATQHHRRGHHHHHNCGHHHLVTHDLC